MVSKKKLIAFWHEDELATTRKFKVIRRKCLTFLTTLTLKSSPLRLAIPRKVPGIISRMRLRLKLMYSREPKACKSTSLMVWKRKQKCEANKWRYFLFSSHQVVPLAVNFAQNTEMKKEGGSNNSVLFAVTQTFDIHFYRCCSALLKKERNLKPPKPI